MKKAEVIIDMPANCACCTLCYCTTSHYGICSIMKKIVCDLNRGQSIINNRYADLQMHPECQLVPLEPEEEKKIDKTAAGDMDRGETDG